MNEIPLYPYSAKEARVRGELEQWRESFRANCACAGMVEIAFRESFDGMHLKDGTVAQVVDWFGQKPNCKPAERLRFGEDEQRNGRDLPLVAGRGIWSLRGRGCSPNARGRSIFCVCLGDGEQTRWNRSEFLGVLKDEFLPDWARENLRQYLPEQAKNVSVGRVTFVNGDTQEFTDAEEYLQCIRNELPDHPVTGFRYETLTDAPSVRKAVDDALYDLYGEENPRPLEDYETKSSQNMTLGGM